MENVPDPQRTHFLWGFSKDFGLASFRFGVLHTFNKDLMKIMEGMCLYSSVEGHIQQMGGRMLQDKKWLDETYFPMNLKRVRSAFEDCKSFFEKYDWFSMQILRKQSDISRSFILNFPTLWISFFQEMIAEISKIVTQFL